MAKTQKSTPEAKSQTLNDKAILKLAEKHNSGGRFGQLNELVAALTELNNYYKETEK